MTLALDTYRLLGRSGLRVSPLALGTATFGTDWGWGADAAESRKLLEAYVERGGNFIDTANTYTNGNSESFLGEFTKDFRESLVLATKYTTLREARDPNSGGPHRKSLIGSVESSLRRLNTEYIDLLYLHVWDATTSVDEVMRGLDDLVRQGKVLYVAMSNVPAWQIARMQTLADLRGWAPLVALQIEYSLIERTPERELLPMARAFDMAVTAWGAIGGGVLSGKYQGKVASDTKRQASNQRRLTDKNLAIAEEVKKIAIEIDKKPSQVALAWVRQQPGNLIPIIGARTVEQLNDNLGCLDVTLSPAQLERLSRVSAIELGFPYDFLALDGIRRAVHGNHYERIENHRAIR